MYDNAYLYKLNNIRKYIINVLIHAYIKDIINAMLLCIPYLYLHIKKY